MRGKRVKWIYKLVYNKDPNMLDTIERERKEVAFSKMSGARVYRWAKRLWRKHGIVDQWGKQTN